VRVLSPGDDGNVSQTNAVASTSAATDLSTLAQRIVGGMSSPAAPAAVPASAAAPAPVSLSFPAPPAAVQAGDGPALEAQPPAQPAAPVETDQQVPAADPSGAPALLPEPAPVPAPAPAEQTAGDTTVVSGKPAPDPATHRRPAETPAGARARGAAPADLVRTPGLGRPVLASPVLGGPVLGGPVLGGPVPAAVSAAPSGSLAGPLSTAVPGSGRPTAAAAGGPARPHPGAPHRFPLPTRLPADGGTDLGLGAAAHGSGSSVSGTAALVGLLLFLATGLAQWLWAGAELRPRALRPGRPERPG
jgi:hypothetical protein